MSTKSLGSSESSLNTTTTGEGETGAGAVDKRYTNNDNNDDDDDDNVVMSRVSVNTSYSDSSCPGAVLVASSLDMSATTDPANSDSKAISIRVNLTQGGS